MAAGLAVEQVGDFHIPSGGRRGVTPVAAEWRTLGRPQAEWDQTYEE